MHETRLCLQAGSTGIPCDWRCELQLHTLCSTAIVFLAARDLMKCWCPSPRSPHHDEGIRASSQRHEVHECVLVANSCCDHQDGAINVIEQEVGTALPYVRAAPLGAAFHHLGLRLTLSRSLAPPRLFPHVLLFGVLQLFSPNRFPAEARHSRS